MAIQFQNYNFIGDAFATGGINLKSAVTNLKDNESPECRNVVFTQTGSVQKRKGYSKLNQTQITEAGVPQTTTGIYQHQKSDGLECVIIGSGTNLYDGVTSPVSIKTGQTSGALYDFTSLNDFAIIVNGVDSNLKYDCLTVSNLGIDPPGAAPTFNANIAGVNLSFPGFYQYVVTFVNAQGEESNPSPVSATIPTIAVTQDLRINIPISTDTQVTARNIYRTTTDGVNPGAIFFLAGTVADNVTVTFDDHTSDLNLGVEVEFDNDTPPVLKFIETHKNRLFGIEAASPNRLRFSKQFSVGEWPALNFIDINPDDGDMISGMVSFFDQLPIFKRESIYVLSGNDETDFVIQRAQSDVRVGAISNRSIKVIDNRVAFLSERGIYAYDGIRTQYISQNLEAIFDKANVNQARRFNWAQEGITVAINYKNGSRTWYWLQIPTGSSQQNDLSLVFDYTLGNWTIFDGIVAHSMAIVEESNEPRLYTGDYNGFLWKQDNTNNDGFVHFPSFSTSSTNGVNTLRDESQAEFDTGTGVTLVRTSTALGGVNTLIDAGLTMIVNDHIGEQIFIEAGTGAGQLRTILSNTATVFTVSVNWGVVPDATSQYVVGGWPIDGTEGVRVKILDGIDAGDIRTIVSNTPIVFTVSVNWTTIPDTTSEYSIGFIDGEWQSRWFHYNNPEFVKRLMYVYVNANRERNYDLDVVLKFDFFTGFLGGVLLSLALSGSDAVWDESLWDVDTWDQVGQTITRLTNSGSRIHRYVQVTFRNEAGSQPFTVNSFNYVYQVKGVRR